MIVVAVMMLAGMLITVVLALGGAIVARHRAEAIADLSALAAVSGPSGSGGCDRARRIAAANAGRLTSCRLLADGSVVVEVGLAARSGSGSQVTGSARAGRSTVPGPSVLGPSAFDPSR